MEEPATRWPPTKNPEEPVFVFRQGGKAHQKQGLVTVAEDPEGRPLDWAKVTGNLLRIHSQSERPTDAFVRINYRGHWFRIEDRDLHSKATFNLLTYLFSLQAAGAKGVSPLLTVPVGVGN